MSSTRALLATWSKVLSPKDFERYKAPTGGGAGRGEAAP
jgi:hypothetical protein